MGEDLRWADRSCSWGIPDMGFCGFSGSPPDWVSQFGGLVSPRFWRNTVVQTSTCIMHACTHTHTHTNALSLRQYYSHLTSMVIPVLCRTSLSTLPLTVYLGQFCLERLSVIELVIIVAILASWEKFACLMLFCGDCVSSVP